MPQQLSQKTKVMRLRHSTKQPDLLWSLTIFIFCEKPMLSQPKNLQPHFRKQIVYRHHSERPRQRLHVSILTGGNWFNKLAPTWTLRQASSKPGNTRREYNASARYKVVCLNDKLLTGSDLLVNFFGIVMTFGEQKYPITAWLLLLMKITIIFAFSREKTNWNSTNIEDIYLVPLLHFRVSAHSSTHPGLCLHGITASGKSF